MISKDFSRGLLQMIELTMRSRSVGVEQLASDSELPVDEVASFLQELREGGGQVPLSTLADVCAALELRPFLAPPVLAPLFEGHIVDALDPVESVFDEVFVRSVDDETGLRIG